MYEYMIKASLRLTGADIRGTSYLHLPTLD